MARKRRKKSANMEIVGVILMAFGAILAFGIYFGSAGMLGVAFQNVCLGLFGTLSYALPPAIIALGVYVAFYMRRPKKSGPYVCAGVIALCVICLWHLIFTGRPTEPGYFASVAAAYGAG